MKRQTLFGTVMGAVGVDLRHAITRHALIARGRLADYRGWRLEQGEHPARGSNCTRFVTCMPLSYAIPGATVNAASVVGDLIRKAEGG